MKDIKLIAIDIIKVLNTVSGYLKDYNEGKDTISI